MPPLQNEPTFHPQEVVPANVVLPDGHELHSEEKTPLNKRQRSVRFATEVEIYPVIRRQDMSPEEMTNMWMNRFDRRDNKCDIHNTIFLMRSGLTMKLTEDDFFCPRGLENFLNPTTEQKNVCKKSVGIALAMQRVLRKTGTSNPLLIARAYHKYTIQSQQVAHKKALYDQAFVSWNREKNNTKKGKHSCDTEVVFESA